MLKKTGKDLSVIFLKIYYSFSLVYYKPWDRGKLQLSQNTVKNPILNPSTHIYQSCSGPHWGLRRAPGALFDTHWTVSVLVGVKRVYRRALQGLYFT